MPHLLCALAGGCAPAAHASRGTESGLSAEDEMAVAVVQAQVSSWLHPSFPMLSLLSSTSLPWSEHTHSCLLRSAAPSLLPRLWSPLLQEGVCAPSALSAPTSVKLLSSALRPRSLLSSLCLPQLQLFDCQVFFQSWVYQTFGLRTPSKLKIPKNFLFMKVVSVEF